MKSVLQLTLVTHKKDTLLDNYLAFIARCVDAGVTAVQLREKSLSLATLFDFGQALQAILQPRNIPLIINDSPQLAYQLNAAGVHLGQSDGCVQQARQLLGPQKIIGLTVDTLEQLIAANQLPINYVGVGAIFPTHNKANIATLWGCEGLQKITALSRHPVIAIGGIDTSNVRAVMAAGAGGIAAISAFHDASDPTLVTQQLRYMIEGK
jgi:thiamine-phosphate pyrophosphorylase